VAVAAITVVIPTRSRAFLLDQTLRSIDRQTSPVEQVVIADDGSTDETPKVARDHGATHLRNAAGGWGAAGARNAGLRAASGDLVAFVDSDDLLLPTGLERLASVLDRAPNAPFAYGWALTAVRRACGWQPTGLIAATSRELADPLRSLFANNYVPSSGVLIRADHARAVGGYDESLTFSEDHHLWLRLAQRGTPARAEELVCVYRQHAGNRHGSALALRDERAIWRLADADPGFVRGLGDRAGVQLCEHALEAWHARRPQAFVHLLRGAAASGLGIAEILSSALRHFRERRERRERRRRAFDLWSERDDLRQWLAEY
jgi:glycosyltransferase involved in cell wall biosynthesis